MAISKRTRFEVLRRDNYTCRYCRSTESELTIDHVTPVALGGSNDPSNLVACCKACNSGKSSTSPDEGTVAQVADDAVRWANARRQAARAFNDDRKERRVKVAPFREAWTTWDEKAHFLPADWEEKVYQWLSSGLTMGRVLDAHSIAIGRNNVPAQSVFAYMCGIVRNWLDQIDATTEAILSAEDSQHTPDLTLMAWQASDIAHRLLCNTIEGTHAELRAAFDEREWDQVA